MAISGFLEQSATVTLQIGPFVDDADGNTVEGALTIAQADVRLSKNGGNIAQKNNATSCTHDELGMYTCPLSTTDTNTLGILTLVVHEAGALHVRHDYMVVTTQVFDSLFGTDRLQVHVAEMTNDIITAAAIAANAIGSSELATGAIDAAQIAANAMDGKGDWNVGKTGYSLTQSFPANFADLVIAATTGELDVNVVEWLAATPNALLSGRVDAVEAILTGTADSGSTTTFVDAALTEADTDYWVGNYVRFFSAGGAAIGGQVRLITGFVPGTDTITFSPATTLAVTTNQYEIIPGGSVDIIQTAADKVFGSGGAALSELSVGIPAATPRPDQAMMLLYMALRNKLDVTETIKEVHNNAGTIIATKALTDDGTTYSEAEMISG